MTSNFFISTFSRKFKFFCVGVTRNFVLVSQFLFSLLENSFFYVVKNFTYYLLLLNIIFIPRYSHSEKNGDKKIFVTVTCHQDRLEFLLMFFSLQRVLRGRMHISFYVVEDGTFSPLDYWLCLRAGVYSIKKAKGKNFREIKYLDIKRIFKGKRIVLLDSDLLFFRFPAELFGEKTLFMRDYMSRYALSNDEIKYFLHKRSRPAVNTGLGVFSVDMMKGSLFTAVMKYVNKVAQSRNVVEYYAEQTAFAISLSDVKNFYYFPDQYFLFARSIVNKEIIPKDVICIHYATMFYKRMVFDAVKLMIQGRFF